MQRRYCDRCKREIYHTGEARRRKAEGQRMWYTIAFTNWVDWKLPFPYEADLCADCAEAFGEFMNCKTE